MTSLFTDRAGGVSRGPFASLNLARHVGDDPAAVAENRRRLHARLGAPLVWMEQCHGAAVAVVGERELAAGGEVTITGVDALVTATAGLALAVVVADCSPVLLHDRGAGVAAAVHAGRPGLVAGVVPAALAAMDGLGARRHLVQAVIGPCIGGCCYELPAALVAEVEAVAPGSAAVTRWGTPSVDLRSGLRRQLAAAGVSRVRDVVGCTYDSTAHFSYRRDGRTGRFAAVAATVVVP